MNEENCCSRSEEPAGTAPAARDCAAQILESLSSGIVAINAEGVILLVNRAARQYLSQASDGIRPGVRLDTAPGAQPLVEVFEEVVRTGAPITRREIAFHLPEIGEKAIGLSASPLLGKAGFDGVIFLFTDLTELRKLERAAELNRQLATLGELTAGVVHELRNPVSIISGMAELLIRKIDTHDDRRSAAEAILRESVGLERAIAQFLAFAKPYDLERAWRRPEDIAHRAIQFCQRRAQHKEMNLECQCAQELPTLFVDADRIAQALANILVNAVDVAPHAGLVGLRVYAEKQYVIFEVTDNGPGIHLQPGENLFTPFFTQKEGGTGLGLTIAHRIIAAHDGAISYANRKEGGARFCVRLPIKDAMVMRPES